MHSRAGWKFEHSRGTDDLLLVGSGAVLAVTSFTSGMSDLYKGLTAEVQTQRSQRGLPLINQIDDTGGAVVRLSADSVMNKTLAEIVRDAL